MAPKVQRTASPFLQIAEHYRMKIKDGALPQDSKLPSIASISREWGVATATAAKAIKQLQEEGYVRSSSQGTFVDLGRKLTSGSDRLQMLRATGSGFRKGETVEILSAGLVAAPGHVAEALKLSEGDQVVQRRRVYRDDDGVVAVSTSYLAGELAEAAPELLEAGPLPKMTFGLIEERTGRRAVRRRDVVAMFPVPQDIAEVLEAEAGSLALTMTNLYWDDNGEPTEYARDFLGAGRELSAEYPMD
ncbi:GntR family transcriptional regulator [Streptomyces ossamyceticus]|uniref:GntR family transcriptional regulator n=1 Tax=Streptomyces ossamyceticus TaxID=249581 RepID=UPI0006E234EE|nr:GntR family transcriptional regulator [Streptomyces ossamyceticus]